MAKSWLFVLLITLCPGGWTEAEMPIQYVSETPIEKMYPKLKEEVKIW
jgi:hypothetical protein